ERTALLREATETLLLLLGPFCPHVTEELWSRLRHSESVFPERWPAGGAGRSPTRRGSRRPRLPSSSRSTARCAGGWSSTWTPPTSGSGSWPSATTASGRGSAGGGGGGGGRRRTAPPP